LAGAAITRRITSAAMGQPLIVFAGDSVAVKLLFDEYYGINNDGDGNDDDNNGGEGMTVLGARVLDRCTDRCKAARTGLLHGSNRLASTSLVEGLIFGMCVGKRRLPLGPATGGHHWRLTAPGAPSSAGWQ
jgi:hypothetical protein